MDQNHISTIFFFFLEERRLTATRKNRMDSIRKINGRLSQPNARTTTKKTTSIGRVTQRSVIMTTVVLGGRLHPPAVTGVIERAAACRDVDNREARIHPTDPGSPV